MDKRAPFPRPARARRAWLSLLAIFAVSGAFPVQGRPARPAGTAPGTERAHFALCHGSHRVTCVVDGDTLWYRGEKVRIADINAPETHGPRCATEAALGERATARLIALLNAGPFALEPGDAHRNRDRYGRLLRVVTRDGHSLGATLEAEGLAEHWRGRRRDWCRPALASRRQWR